MIKIEKNGAVMEVLDEHQFAAYAKVGWKRYTEKPAVEEDFMPKPQKPVETAVPRRGRRKAGV